jgi:hypothetical protein
MAPKWLVIAKYEYLVKTSGFRRWRVLLPILMVAFIMFYIFILAPAMFSLFEGYTAQFILSEEALSFMQVILLIIFASVITIPIMQTLQDSRISPLEAVIAAPVRPMDVLVGRFLGTLPFYCMVVALIAGTFLALFIPFGMSPAQVAISIMVFLLLVVSGLWLGVLVAAVLKARLGRTARGRDMGQALALLIALPLAAVMYGVMNGGVFKAAQGEGTTPIALWLLPSSWGADVVLRFLRHPGDLGWNWQVTMLGLGGLVLFFLGSLYLGNRLSGRVYDLEPVSFSSSRAAPEGLIYRSIRTLTGHGPFSVVVITVVKDYLRRMENLSRVIYIIGLVVLMELFLLNSLPPGNYIGIALLTISWMMAFLCVFVVGEVTARGKDNLFIYRKAPHGERRLIWARVVQGWLVVQPVAAISALVVLVPSDIPWGEVMSYTIALVGISSAYVVMSIGLFLLSPAFSERPSETIGNALAVLIISFVLYVLCLVLFGDPWGIWALVVVSWTFGLAMLAAGSRKIRRVE